MKSGVICECCRTFYVEEERAKACESSHIKVGEGVVVASEHLPPGVATLDRQRYPHRIQIRFGNWVQTYEATSGRRTAG